MSGLCRDCLWYEEPGGNKAVGTCYLLKGPDLSHPHDPRTESKARVSFCPSGTHDLEVDPDFGCIQFEARD